MYTWNYKEELVGVKLNVPDGAVYRYDGEYLRSTSVTVNNNTTAATIILTGWYITKNGTNYCQTTSGMMYEWNASQVESGYVSTTTISASASDAQKYIDGIITCNKSILENNLFCARYASKLTSDQRLLLYNLQQRLALRNDALEQDGLATQQSSSYPQGYGNLTSYLDKFMSNPQIGAAATLYIVVSAVVVASLATAAYYAYKAYYTEALKDVQYSDELTAVLKSKLTDEEYAQLEKETAGMVTAASLSAKLGTSFGWVKYLALGGLVAYLTYSIFKRNGNKK